MLKVWQRYERHANENALHWKMNQYLNIFFLLSCICNFWLYFSNLGISGLMITMDFMDYPSSVESMVTHSESSTDIKSFNSLIRFPYCMLKLDWTLQTYWTDTGVWSSISSWLTHLPWTKWPCFPRRHFQMHFHEWKVLYCDSNFIEVCS